MAISEEEVLDFLLDHFIERGYLGFDGNSFRTSSGLSTTSIKKLIKNLNIEESLRGSGRVLELSFLIVNMESSSLMSALKRFKYSRESHFGDITPDIKRCLKYEVYKTLDSTYYNDPDSRMSKCHVVLIDRDEETVLNPESTHITGVLALKGKDRKDTLGDTSIPFAKVVLDRKNGEFTFLDAAGNYCINLNVRPFWAKEWSKSPDLYQESSDGLLWEIVRALFPDEEDLNYVLDWLHHAAFGKKPAGTALVLVGQRGVGKSTFAEIVSRVVGRDNSEVIPESFFNSFFNSQIQNKRLLISEEMQLDTDTKINKVKALTNDRVSMESKGQNAKTIDNYASFMFLLNDKGSVMVEPQERRFSIPRLSEVDLKKSVNNFVSRWTEFVDNCEDVGTPQFSELVGFCLAIRSRTLSYGRMEPLKGEYFMEVSNFALSNWKKRVLDYIVKNAKRGVPLPLNVSKIFPESEFGRVRTGVQKISNWLSDYRHMGEYRLGVVIPYKKDDSGDSNLGVKSREFYALEVNDDFFDKFCEGSRDRESVQDLL